MLILQRKAVLSHEVSGAQSTAFVPTDLPMLSAWWDASDSCYNSGALATNGQTITELRDKSGNSRHLTNSGSPTFVASGIKSRGTVQFTGSSTLSRTATFNYDLHHIFVVLKSLGADKNFIGSDNRNSGDIMFQFDTSRRAKAHIWTSSGAQAATHGTTFVDNTVAILEQWVDATTINVALNGGTPVSTTLVGTKGGGSKLFVLGSDYVAAGNWFAGQVGEVVLCTGSSLSAGQRSDVIAYLTNGWL
jgi:hypothetical protein